MIAISIDTKPLEAKMKQVRKTIAPARIRKIATLAIAGQIRNHLFELDATRPNKLGGTRTHFYSQAAQSLHVDEGGEGARESIISVSSVGFAQRYFGGIILPRRVRYLTIPATAESYGRAARSFPDLRFAIKEGRPALVRGDDVMYWLARRVKQRADPTVLPTPTQMGETGTNAVDRFLDRELAREATQQ